MYLMMRKLKIIKVAAGSRLQLIEELQVEAALSDTFLPLMMLTTILHKKRPKKTLSIIKNIFYIIII